MHAEQDLRRGGGLLRSREVNDIYLNNSVLNPRKDSARSNINCPGASARMLVVPLGLRMAAANGVGRAWQDAGTRRMAGQWAEVRWLGLAWGLLGLKSTIQNRISC
jgi:hypothetical protein